MINDYTTLITSEHADKPRFLAVVEAMTRPLVETRQTAEDLPLAFDLDLAVGAQLDVVGIWVGLSREFTVPISAAFFSWNVSGLGWNEGSWKGPFAPSLGMTSLDDEAYRTALRAKIGKNYWNGSNSEQNAILHESLQDFGVDLIPVDNFDMSFNLHLIGSPPPAILELVRRGYFIPKPCGVRINLIMGPASGGSTIFALDSVSAGLDAGSFL